MGAEREACRGVPRTLLPLHALSIARNFPTRRAVGGVGAVARLRLFRSLRPRLAATAARGASAIWEARTRRQAASPPHQPPRAALILPAFPQKSDIRPSEVRVLVVFRPMLSTDSVTMSQCLEDGTQGKSSRGLFHGVLGLAALAGRGARRSPMSFISARLRNRDPRLGGEAVVREQRRLRLPECDHERARDRVRHVIVPPVGGCR